MSGEIFVFGSNLNGAHGAGSAKEAHRNWGAVYGQAVGLQGNSYAIPTKDRRYRTLPIPAIIPYVDEYIDFVERNPELQFRMVAIGCGLAGYQPSEMAPLFGKLLGKKNVVMPDEFVKVLKMRKMR